MSIIQYHNMYCCGKVLAEVWLHMYILLVEVSVKFWIMVHFQLYISHLIVELFDDIFSNETKYLLNYKY